MTHSDGCLASYPRGGDRFLIAEPAQWAAATPLPSGRQCGRSRRWTSRAGAGGRRRERVELVYPGAVTGSAIWDRAAPDRTMLWAWSAPWPPPVAVHGLPDRRKS